MTCFCQSGHELVKLGDEFFLNTFRPIFLSEELREELCVHLVQQIIQGVTIHEADQQDVLDVSLRDGNIESLLDEVAYLEFSNIDAKF